MRHPARHAFKSARFPFPTLATVAALLLVEGGLASPLARATPPAVSAGEFKLYKDYLGALTDERVQKMAEAKRLPAIARNFKVAETALRTAVERAEKAGPDVGRQCEAEVRSVADEGPLKGRLTSVQVDDSEAHVVTYVSWKNEDGDLLEEEASWAAIAVSKGAPITSTIALWAVDASTGQKVFEAKISAEAAARFSPARIPMFAQTRYIRIFEDVRNLYKGNPPASDAPEQGAN